MSLRQRHKKCDIVPSHDLPPRNITYEPAKGTAVHFRSHTRSDPCLESPVPVLNPAPLLTPIQVGSLALRNRVVMAPLSRSRSNSQGVPPDFAADYYAQRASAGLIVSEATNISAQARGYEYTPGIWTDAQVASWRNVTSVQPGPCGAPAPRHSACPASPPGNLVWRRA